MTDVGYTALTKNIIMAFTKRAMAVMLENSIDRMKISTQDVDLVLWRWLRDCVKAVVLLQAGGEARAFWSSKCNWCCHFKGKWYMRAAGFR